MVGVVGESGSGKSVSMLTVMGLTRASNASISGSVRFQGRDLLSIPDQELRRVRGNDIAMIFQDPLSSLHPFYRVGWQLVEAMQAHRDISDDAARDRAVELLGMVGIPDPRQRVDAYPHELSGGMRQRAMIAMALSNEPKLLIADEPTTALDVTVQAQILQLIARLQRELGMAVVLITHDLGVVAEVTDQIAVMYAGRIVEAASTEKIFRAPEHPYTWGLLRSIPRLDKPRDEPLIPIAGLPPSLINLPTGCSFHPRCPYVRERHRRVEPQLETLPDDPTHRVACLLESQIRKRIWSELRGGMSPQEARAAVKLEEEPA
jgi:peptide/nickel transport system ATP-binding protein